MFTNYLYTSSTSKTFRDHFIKSLPKQYVKDFRLNKRKSLIIDIGSNDGIALKPFKEMGYKKYTWNRASKKFIKISKQKWNKNF